MAKTLLQQYLEIDPRKLTEAERNIFSRVEKQPPLKPYRDASKTELKALQDSYKYIRNLLQESGSKITKQIPSLKQYTKEYEGSKVNARSDYIYEISKELKRLTNIYIRKAEKKAENLAVDYSAYKLDYRKSILKFAQQVKSLTSMAQKILQSNIVVNDTHDFYGNQKYTFETYNNFNELALNNLYYSIRQQGWDELLEILKSLDQNRILKFWKENRKNLDLSFTYKTADLIGTDQQIMTDLWLFINPKEKDKIKEQFYRLNYDILIPFLGRYEGETI